MEDLKGVYIPEQLYVTYKEETSYNYKTKTNEFECILAFMSPYAKDKAFEKRQDTQLRWAYGSTEFRDEDKLTVIYKRYNEIEIIPNNLQPNILDNDILSGYQIGNSIKKTYWGGGNVTWRIKDPRGYELEISSANLSKILECSSIENNLIKDPCIWVRLGSQNLLVPTTSELYKQIEVKSEQRKMDKIPLKEIKIGNVIKLYDDSAEYYYYGSMNIVENYVGYQYAHDDRKIDDYYHQRYSRTHSFISHQSKKYVLINNKTGDFKTLSSPKVIQIISENTCTKQQALDIINNNYTLREKEQIAFVTEKPIKAEDVSIAFIEWSNEGTVFTSNGLINDTKNKRIYKTDLDNNAKSKAISYSMVSNFLDRQSSCKLDYTFYTQGYTTYYKLALKYNNQYFIQDLTF